MSASRRRWLVAGAVVALIASPALAWYVLVRAPDDRRARALSEQLDRDIADFRSHWQSVERPVLRGEPMAGNAAQLARVAATRIPATPELPGDIADRVAEGDVPDDIIALARTHDRELRAVREATRARQAWTDIAVERGGAATELPSYMPLLRAARLLAVQAHVAPPGECLRIGADTIRMAQDLAPGAGILGAVIAATLIEEIAPVIEQCLARATPEERAEAAREIELLAAHAPPIGAALELEALLAAATFRISADAPLVPTTEDDLDAIRFRTATLEAWEVVGRNPAQWRALTGNEALAAWRSAETLRRASPNPLLALSAPESITAFIEKDMRAQRRLEALAAAARAPSPLSDPNEAQ